ncbi:MAG TPA: DUF3015 family protein [Thermodesulfobacteriota bacterium]|nr:DUF3015 family protein [Thermodesulfobacteriota bacterium]
MKKIVMAFAILAFVAGVNVQTSRATTKAQMNTGCGLGATLITEADSLVAQLAITFLNGLSGNGTFGITSGTSDCKQATKVVSNDLLKFVADNMDTLSKDMASGEGETLLSLAELMNVSKEARPEFYAALQANFSSVFTSETIEAGEVIDNIMTVTAKG